MASNKNQHFVPRCYLRPFTLDGANLAINLFNVDQRKSIENAPVKNQCSGDYFYGKDSKLEKALRATEGAYAGTLDEVLTPGYRLIDAHRVQLKRFWLLQHMRTEAASLRSLEMIEGVTGAVGTDPVAFRMGIKDAVQLAMRGFVDAMHILDDLKVCLLRNRTRVPFVTSDDPAVMTNRWHIQSERTRGRSFGLSSSGAIVLLPMNPNVLCVGYDGDVYSLPHEGGWVAVERESDVQALNEHQFLGCWANIYFREFENSAIVETAYSRITHLRPATRYVVHVAVPDREEGDLKRYRVVDAKPSDVDEALLHWQMVQPRPSSWPTQLAWRSKGSVYTNGTGLGYVRKSRASEAHAAPFRREPAR